MKNFIHTINDQKISVYVSLKNIVLYFFLTACFCSCALSKGSMDDSELEKISQFLHEGINKIPQNANYCIANNPLADNPIAKYDQELIKSHFFRQYFTPWDATYYDNVTKKQAMLSAQKKRIDGEFRLLRDDSKKEWGARWNSNKQRISEEFLENIQRNMNIPPDIEKFSSPALTAIVVHNTPLRYLPAKEAVYDNPHKQKTAIHFDEWQSSNLKPNDPLCLFHETEDGIWALVCTHDHGLGWVQRRDIAFVTPEFIKRWKTGNYVTPLRDTVEVKDSVIDPIARIGQFFPLASENINNVVDHYNVFSVDAHQGNAVIRSSSIDKEDCSLMPVLFTQNNIAKIVNGLVGQKYDWGSTNGYRDCSGFIKDILSPMGLLMPRLSVNQQKQGESTDLTGLTEDQKKQVIMEKGIPFLTLLYQPGHIMLYVGNRDNNIYIVHAAWALRFKDYPYDRAVIGKVVVMDMDLGKEREDLDGTLLKKCTSLINLKNKLTSPS